MAKKVLPSQMNSTTLVAWMALVVALLALSAAYGGWGRIKEKTLESGTTQKVSTTVNEQMEAAQDKLEQAQRLIKAGDYSGAEKLLVEVRSDLKIASANLTGTAKAEWEKLDSQLEDLTVLVQKKTASTVGEIAKALVQLQKLILSL